LKNLRDALKRLADRSHGPVRNAAEIAAATRSLPLDPARPIKTEISPEDSESAQALVTPHSPPAQSKWRLLYDQVIELRQQQISQREIARRTGLDRGTVGRYLKAGTFPERTPGRSCGPKSSLGIAHLSHLKRRWDEGCRNATQLFHEVQSQGFRGSYYAVRRALAKWRVPGSSASSSAKNVPAFKVPSASNVAWLLFKSEQDLQGTEQRFVKELKNLCPSIKHGADLGQEFIAMIRERQIENWPTWFERATAADVPQDIRNFALGLKLDEAAVKAALSLEWSNGQLEGQINRLKTLKRQMYGRGSLELLRKRMLLAA
jgi:transposase